MLHCRSTCTCTVRAVYRSMHNHAHVRDMSCKCMSDPRIMHHGRKLKVESASDVATVRAGPAHGIHVDACDCGACTVHDVD